MTGNPTLDIILYLFGLLGMGGVVSGIVVKSVNRRIDRSDERREALERARLEADILNGDGLCCVGSLAEATAIAVRDGKTNGETKRALEEYKLWRGRREAFIQRQAAEHLRGEAV